MKISKIIFWMIMGIIIILLLAGIITSDMNLLGFILFQQTTLLVPLAILLVVDELLNS